MSLVNTEWLEAKIDKVKIIDSSWHLPQANRDGHSEYKKEHIKNSIFFDIEKYSRKNIELPHMLVDKNDWKIRDKSLIRDRLLLYNNDILIGVLYYSLFQPYTELHTHATQMSFLF